MTLSKGEQALEVLRAMSRYGMLAMDGDTYVSVEVPMSRSDRMRRDADRLDEIEGIKRMARDLIK